MVATVVVVLAAVAFISTNLLISSLTDIVVFLAGAFSFFVCDDGITSFLGEAAAAAGDRLAPAPPLLGPDLFRLPPALLILSC